MIEEIRNAEACYYETGQDEDWDFFLSLLSKYNLTYEQWRELDSAE